MTPRDALRRVLFRYGWDTRSRHHEAVRLLRAAARERTGAGQALLDVGCGRAGMAAFLPDVEVMGVDLETPEGTLPNRAFTAASIDALPFADGSFPSVACIDVLQDLPPDVRAAGIGELVRVARDLVVIASPQGEVARRTDEAFGQALRARRAPVPSWVDTSLAHPYPTADEVVAAVRRADPAAQVTVSYGEPARISHRVRAAAARSRALYALTNLAFGAIVPLLPEPGADAAYRMLVVVRPGRRTDEEDMTR